MDEQSLFTQALEISDPAGRAAFLDRACGADAALRARLERLLAQHDAAGSFLERPAAGAGEYTPEHPGGAVGPAEAAGAQVGPYKLLEVIGEGGMGTVWMAEQ